MYLYFIATLLLCGYCITFTKVQLCMLTLKHFTTAFYFKIWLEVHFVTGHCIDLVLTQKSRALHMMFKFLNQLMVMINTFC